VSVPSHDRVRVERDGTVAVWTVNRPEVRNAVDFATLDALVAAVAEAQADANLRAVVLTAAGATFVSGGDLRELRKANSRDDGARIAALGRRVCDGFAALRVPVIGALPGPAIGGGAELAVACDLRVADPRAKLSFKHARMGVTTAWGTLPKLVGMVGQGQAARLLLTGHDVDAAEALRIGLVEGVSEEGDSLATAVSWAHQVAKSSPGAIAGFKQLLSEAAVGSPAQLRARELDLFVEAWAAPDHEEAVESFFEARPPKWGARG
jgi:enoyl-CoA hydratase